MNRCNLGVVACVYNSSVWEAEAGGSRALTRFNSEATITENTRGHVNIQSDSSLMATVFTKRF